MNTYADKTQKNKNQSVANEVSQKHRGGGSTFQFMDNRDETIAQRKLIELANNRPQVQQLRAFQDMSNNNTKTNKLMASAGSNECIQGQFTLSSGPMGARHLGPIERWVGKFHPSFVENFQTIKTGSEPVDINTWLVENFHESYETILKADSAMEDCLGNEITEDELLGGPGPPTVTLAYGEESCRGALAEVRRDPSLSRRGNRYIATTPSAEFPADEESRMAREELEKRGGEALTGVDVQESPLAEESTLPFNTTDLRFRYPRTNRGTRPSTADITSSYVDRVAETGQGELAIPTPAMYGGRAATRNSLYGAKRFEETMRQQGQNVSQVRPGPENQSELGPFGYSHRMTDREQERGGGVSGKTLVIEPGGGPREMDEGD
ncbi:hypothetical protein [Rheinheimera sp. EpRS3]|uniref:hypothetical protein n=1 Tax=Rheinheimera sp. EpRS3 TaxID=1712383 RepID=UPI0007490AD2|nr:hypothetical protein [Rheinheimera sp. EpRS3]KUM54661.1 hypothetical protein AR688_15370 [Rheinheimera sp. EpRS3]